MADRTNVKGRGIVSLASLGLLLAVLVSSTAASGVRRYDAKATYSCLRHRPEFRPIPFDWYPGKPGVRKPPLLAFYLIGGDPPVRGRHAGNWPVRGPGVGASWGFVVYPVGLAAFPAIRIAVFDQVSSARAAYRAYLQEFASDPSARPLARKAIMVTRNVTLDTDSPNYPRYKQIRALVLGCLRTR